MRQTTNAILMIRPINFRMNEQTAVNNYYQKKVTKTHPETINSRAQDEFDAFVNKLRIHGVRVIVASDTDKHDTPDAIFPNNWISFHQDGTVGVYPMFAENRRLERRSEIFDQIEDSGFLIKNIVDYTSAEEEGMYLEGTGSIILDRINKKPIAHSPLVLMKMFLLNFAKILNTSQLFLLLIRLWKGKENPYIIPM